MRMRSLWVGGCAAVLAASLGCATNHVQAPFDSFVCFNSSFKECLEQAQNGQLDSYQRSSFRSLGAPSRSVLLRATELVDSLPSRVATSDGKYECRLETIPYVPTLRQEVVAPVVFVSPILIRQIGELQVRLERSRADCDRLVADYEYQRTFLAQQDLLSNSQKISATLAAEIERERNAKDGLGARIAQVDETEMKIPLLPGMDPIVIKLPIGRTVRDLLETSRNSSLSLGEGLREQVKVHALDVEFKSRFEDINFTLDLQRRELARNLFILDRSVDTRIGRGIRRSGYRGGSWVMQGTIVAADTRRGGE